MTTIISSISSTPITLPEDPYTHEDFDTCGFCLEVRPYAELEAHEHEEGALLCDSCWEEYLTS